jgi:diaminopimelate epimerase
VGVRFTKVESVGNDYVLFDAIEEPGLARLDDLVHYAQVLSHRRTGVGSDGLLILTKTADGLAMRVINADGSAGGICGNGLRCAIKVAIERGHTRGPQVVVRVGDRDVVGTVTAMDGEIVRAVRVDMGAPRFDAVSIPLDPRFARDLGDHRWGVGEHALSCASMGNPHAVRFTQEEPREVIKRIGPVYTEHRAFPERTNVHAVRVVSNDAIEMAHWERGAGATLGCGSGVCAAVALGVRAGLLAHRVRADVPGGTLRCGWSGNDSDGVWLEGPARVVFVGEWGGER